MSRRVVVGGGGHGKVIADILLASGDQVVGFLDDNPAKHGDTLLGLPVLGLTADWRRWSPDGLVIALGDNVTRRTVAERLTAGGAPWCVAAHPAAILAPSVHLGEGTVVMAGSVINADTQVGRHAIVNTGATIDHDCTVGDYVHVAPGVTLTGGVSIGEGALIGAGTTILPNCRVGAGAIVGAGATVIGDIPAHVTAVGTPARWG